MVIKRRVSRFAEYAFYTRRHKEISKHARSETLWWVIQAALCTLCARMHKEQANEGDVRSDETLIFGLRRCFTALCGLDATSRREKKKRSSKDSRQSILNFKRVIELWRSFLTRRWYLDRDFVIRLSFKPGLFREKISSIILYYVIDVRNKKKILVTIMIVSLKIKIEIFFCFCT